ncbi:MAG: molecular chaperone TorD family protein [Candidatus Hydrogenedentes bacterium]|nr:molecular chaperone TorD family protein [Candidatus Hydrogenedentota bacterium]
MNMDGLKRDVLPAFAAVLEYPKEDFRDRLDNLLHVLSMNSPEAWDEIFEFEQAVGAWPLEMQEHLYTRTFDIGPQCVPYLSVYLFGEQSFKRAELMTGLAQAYERAGCDRGNELPDHLAVVLRFAPHFAGDEWDEMVQWCLRGPLGHMARALAKVENPYQYVLRALGQIVDAAFPEEALHA